jgi:hypothetical protein
VPEWVTRVYTDAENLLVAQLGEPQVDALRSQGAALTHVEALAYLINAVQAATKT